MSPRQRNRVDPGATPTALRGREFTIRREQLLAIKPSLRERKTRSRSQRAAPPSGMQQLYTFQVGTVNLPARIFRQVFQVGRAFLLT